MLAGKSEPALSRSMSRLADKQPIATESGSSLAVSSSRLRQRHSGKSSRKRPAEVFSVTSRVSLDHKSSKEVMKLDM